MNSIKIRLIIILTVTIISATLITIIGVYAQVKNETNTLFDYHLKEVTEVFLNTSSIHWDKFKNRNDKEQIDSDFAVVIFDKFHRQNYATGINGLVPYPHHSGYEELTLSKEMWHTYSLSNDQRTVMFLQPESVREKFAVSTAFNAILPFLLILPIFAVLIWIILKNGFAPLDSIQNTIATIDEHTLEPLLFHNIPRELQSLTDVLNKTINRLKVSIDARKNFIADAAHELRTPISVLKIQWELVYKAEDTTQRKILMHKLYKGIERSNRLVEQLLALSREENYNKTTILYTEIDLSQVIIDVLTESLSSAELKNIALEVDRFEKISMYADRNEIETLVSNLIDNAIGYTPESGLVILNLYLQSKKIVLEVCDNGIGIAENEKTRIFDRFYRVANNATIGSGLGLSIVKEICNKYNACIEVKNNSPQGTVFVISFPAP